VVYPTLIIGSLLAVRSHCDFIASRPDGTDGFTNIKQPGMTKEYNYELRMIASADPDSTIVSTL